MELYKDCENIYNLICLFQDGRKMAILLHIFISSGRLTYYPHELNVLLHHYFVMHQKWNYLCNTNFIFLLGLHCCEIGPKHCNP